QGATRSSQWSELFHSSHSGDILLMFLEQVALVPSPAVRSQALAFALGYASHIAADLALNPWISALATLLPRQRAAKAHSYIELRLDEYLATSYFDHPRYNLLRQPWGAYIEPAARDLQQPGTLAAQILRLLAISAEVYNLDEQTTEALPGDFLAGLQGLRLFLAGRGHARWLTLRARQRGEPQDLVSQVLAKPQSDAEILALDKVLHYAFRLSTHFCQRALNYYTALRNPQAEASERSTRRAALIHDLRNWNLHTGYDTGEQEHAQPLHNWVHFADLWEQTDHEQQQFSKYILPAT
ncbi:MAG TPA: zinc dependent phospholipase C family protein, partial [Ktedonobacteraceae bacterium]|nr:zinc dependent phospholipase C family protein [Ktedonobacteraceae bacterium]